MKRLLFAAALVLAWAPSGATGAHSLPAASCTPTALDAFGPFGRGAPPRRSKIGTGHVLTGIVLGADGCRPLKGAPVELWQSNPGGVYKPSGSATVVTNREGRFRFEGPFPPRYEGLPPHIHIRVQVAGYKSLLSRYVPRDGEKRGSVRLVLEPDDV
jgi:protocatechuate 3,4-dioxygenase beta subunit